MRTIKFRAQDIASNKWLFGDIRHHKNDVCIFEQGGNKGEQVKPETVGQFTGLQDAEGVDIYEGDLLLSHENGEVFEVVYDAPRFCFKDNDFGFRFLNRPENFFVIGHVYDAPKEGGDHDK